MNWVFCISCRENNFKTPAYLPKLPLVLLIYCKGKLLYKILSKTCNSWYTHLLKWDDANKEHIPNP